MLNLAPFDGRWLEVR